MTKRFALILLLLSTAILAAEHVFHYGEISRDATEWLEDRGLPLPEADSFLYWIVMPFLGAMALFGLLQGILKVAWVTAVSLLVSMAVHYQPEMLTDLVEPVLEEMAEIYDDISDDVTSVL